MLFDSQHHEFRSPGLRCWHRRKLWKSFHSNKSRRYKDAGFHLPSFSFLFIAVLASPLNIPFVMARSMTERNGKARTKQIPPPGITRRSAMSNMRFVSPVYDHIQRVNYWETQRTTCFHLTSKDFRNKIYELSKINVVLERFLFLSFSFCAKASTHSSLPSLYMLFYLSSFHKFFIV